MEDRHLPVSFSGSPQQAPGPWREVGERFLRFRPWAVGLGGACSWLVLAAANIERRQLMAVAVGFGVVLCAFVWEARRTRRVPLHPAWLSRSMVWTVLPITVMCAATGGLRSPFFPIYFAPVVTCFAAFGVSARAAQALASLGAALVALVLLPSGWPLPVIPQPAHSAVQVLATLVSVALLYVSVTGLTRAHLEMGQELAESRRQALQEASESLRHLETVSAKVAHEIKNPLSAIKGLLQLLERRSGPDTIEAQRLAVALGEVGRVEEILQGYLSFSRPARALQPQEVSVLALARGLDLLVAPQAVQQGVTWRCQAPEAGLWADPLRLKEALLNLILNALAATEAGGEVALEIALQGQEVVLSVKDTGRGMSGQTLAQATTAFFTTREGGAGLGLAMVQAVARQHGGELRLESEPGQGTTATLRLPRGGQA